MNNGDSMISADDGGSRRHNAWRKLAALALIVAALGLPLNHLAGYAVIVVAAVVIFTGEITARAASWAGAVAVVILAIAGQWWLAPPRIEEGHNIFLPGGAGGALEAGLPSDVYRFMAENFDLQYPPERRCDPKVPGCWQAGGFPDWTFAFSADGVFDKPEFSRRVTGIDFSNPVRLRLGFTNELRYNWYADISDLQRATRDRRFWMGLQRWRLTMPWFAMYRFPPAFTGAQLCWRGDVLWEGDGERFAVLSHARDGCRKIERADIGRRIFGIAIKPDSLAMKLVPPLLVQHVAHAALALVAAFAVVGALVRWRTRRAVVPLLLIGLALLVIAIDDASFIGGMRPFDGGDDGLFYDSVGRAILQQLLAGDVMGALEGGEKVFFYGGPGLRYFRALEHLVFGETYLGYLSLVLLLPIVAFAVFRRFLAERWALALALIFLVIPIGALFGTSFFHYAKWAARGFADPAAYILFLCGLLPIMGKTGGGPGKSFAPAFCGALLLALAIFMKPIVAPAAAVLLGGAGVAAICRRQWWRLAGMGIGFLPVFTMALHNWVFGGVFVLFSANVAHPDVLVMPPAAYAAAVHEIFTFDFSGGYLTRGLAQIAHWLTGPAESFALVPVNAAAIGILVYVAGCGRLFDPWLRLTAGAALAQHGVALFYVASARYHFLAWFLTMVVAAVWVEAVGLGRLRGRFPDFFQRAGNHPLTVRLASGLSWLQRMSA